MIPLPQQSDAFHYGKSGMLIFDGYDVSELGSKFSSPLQIYSAASIKKNIQLMQQILEKTWGENFNIKYSIKSTGSKEIAKICVTEGCGLECFGPGELEIALGSGVEPKRILLNGSAKNKKVLATAVDSGVTISIDNLQDIEYLLEITKNDLSNINFYIRAKVVPEPTDTLPKSAKTSIDEVINFAKLEKWGASLSQAIQIYQRMTAFGAIFQGINVHLGRVLKQDWSFEYWGSLFGRYVKNFTVATNAQPINLDIGGGWTRSRDPMPSAKVARVGADIGLPQFVSAMESQLPIFDAKPVLEVETGRYIVGNAALALAQVVNKKQDLDITWLHVNISTNFLVRIDTSKYQYAVVPTHLNQDKAEDLRIVGETCIDSTISVESNFPTVEVGDLIAILDTGMYTVSTANTFNSIPKPTTILISQTNEIRVLETQSFLPAT